MTKIIDIVKHRAENYEINSTDHEEKSREKSIFSQKRKLLRGIISVAVSTILHVFNRKESAVQVDMLAVC